MEFIQRVGAEVLRRRLAAFRAVIVQGPRQAGKTTLVESYAAATRARFVSFDDPAMLAAARDDPVGVATLSTPLIVDEFQRAGEGFLLAIKRRLDLDTQRGQVILTGSTNYLASVQLGETLAGRAGLVELLPLSVNEQEGRSARFLKLALAGPQALRQTAARRLDQHAYAQLIASGGFPEVVTAVPPSAHNTWFGTYVQTVIDREVREVSDIAAPAQMRRVVAGIAATSAQPLSFSGLASDLGMNRQTLTNYLALLERVFLAVRVPAWTPGTLGRLTGSARLHLIDTGLATSLLGWDASRLADPLYAPAGRLWESFVVLELRKQASWEDAPPGLFHLRGRGGRHEIDAILEWPDGRVVGVEVKRSASPGRGAFTNLAWLRDRLGARFVQGVVLCAVPEPVPFGDRLTAAPISLLWA